MWYPKSGVIVNVKDSPKVVNIAPDGSIVPPGPADAVTMKSAEGGRVGVGVGSDVGVGVGVGVDVGPGVGVGVGDGVAVGSLIVISVLVILLSVVIASNGTAFAVTEMVYLPKAIFVVSH